MLEALGSFVAETQLERIPIRVRDHAKLVVLDTLGVLLAGSTEPDASALSELVLADEHGAAATIFRRGFPKSTIVGAAFANGAACVALELDEGHRYCGVHAASHVLPAALAVAEQRRASGADLLLAFILGYEVAARVACAKTARASVGAHGTWGTIGASAACARLVGLGPSDTTLALRMGSHLSIAAVMGAAYEGATVRNAYVGMAAQAGIRSVQLARAGYRGMLNAPAAVFGTILGDAFDESILRDGLGSRFAITDNFLKLHACCQYNFAALDALGALMSEEQLGPNEIKQIEVRTYRAAIEMSAVTPSNSLQAKFSLPFAMAARVLTGAAGVDAFREATIVDAHVLDVAHRVTLIEDADMTAAFPKNRSAEVTLHTIDGRRLRKTCRNARGDSSDPHPRSAILDKFRALATLVVAAERVELVLDRVLAMERFTDFKRDIVDLLSPPA